MATRMIHVHGMSIILLSRCRDCPCVSEPSVYFRKIGNESLSKMEDATIKSEDKTRRRRGRPQLRPDEETRAILLDAARTEFAIAGIGGRVKSVARRAGVSSKTLYRLIPNKVALFEEAVKDRCAAERAPCRPRRPQRKADDDTFSG